MVDTTSRSVRRTWSLQCQRSLIVTGDGAMPLRHLLNYPRLHCLHCLLLLVGPQRNTVGSLFICALLYNFGLTLPFGGVITGVFYDVSACNAHKVWIIHV